MYYLPSKFFPLFLLLIIVGNPVHAAKQQVIDIKAQYLLLDENKGISKYKGNVVLSTGTLIIKADTVTLHYKNKELIWALITGSPADVVHIPDNEPKMHSQARTIELFFNEDRLILKEQAFVNQGNRHFSGEYIEYDTRQGIVTAAGDKNGLENTKDSKTNPLKGRVHVIIGPTE